MGFLDKTLQKQADQIIAKYGRPGERSLIRELVVDEVGMFLHHPSPKKRRLGILATTSSLYFEHGGKVLSVLPYHGIAYAASLTKDVNPLVTELLELVAHNGDKMRFTFPMKDSGLGRTVQERLLRLDGYEVTKTLSTGHEVTFRYSPWRPDCMSYSEMSGSPDAPASNDAISEAIAFGIGTGEEVGGRAREGRVEVPRWELATDWRERDWTVPVDCLLRHAKLAPAIAWAPGHQIGGGGHEVSYIVGVSECSLTFLLFESMKELLLAERSPVAFDYPFAPMTDWEVVDIAGGHKLVRLLVLGEKALAMPTLEEAIKIEGSYNLLLVGLLDTPRMTSVLDAMVDGVKRHGAFSPGDREFHPLRRNLES